MNYCPERPAKVKLSTFKVTITPHFTAKHEASHLSIHLSLQSPNCTTHHPLFLFETYYGNVPANPFTEGDITASDAAGPLPLYFTNSTENPEGPDQEWRVNRDTIGDIQLKFSVSPRHVDIKTPIGPRVDLRRDQGGLIGNGRYFLPRPAQKDQMYHYIVTWDIARAPAGTRAVWSFGEGTAGSVTKIGDAMVIANSVFMVGPIHSYPNGSTQSIASATMNDDDMGCIALARNSVSVAGNQKIIAAPSTTQVFWFGTLPDNLWRLNQYNIQLFPRLAAFFRSDENTSYRIFIRRVVRGFGGHSCLDSYVLEYDQDSWKEADEELVALFSHEMIHSFVMMGPEPDGYDNGWFTEGLAQFYSAFLPYRFGLRGEDYLRNRLNASLSAYGTSPRIGMDILDSQKEFYNDWYAELIPYMRGCAYLLQIDSRLRKRTGSFSSHQNSPMDEIVIDMAKRWRNGVQLQARDWLSYLYPYLGEHMAQELQDMLRGKVLDMRETIIIHKNWTLSPTEQEILEFGFALSSINKRIICGLIPGSRAAYAGLEDGLPLLSISRAGRCSGSLSENMDLIIRKKGGAKVHISYWPRSFDKARVWQLL
ncbi:uncharacterized protein BP01DRAFT_168727 [Aspergillus saccharolyticus JOP 1030-1]|uniref:Peptidase M61 domain-containing protein n=1 Tax=Aspergillus saccharolyticus JOP 1030-1 TaxID=1450539 RepID=A0A318ZMN0_9EURO|nr:hypothetical protein BP01DRAFT_168727 [Aspergillus saccharolyticus JOP 1030-1]PYH41438.1 hypothetical protein BP01DRAFT_168727 [Aspergillus saccharolyticus JOP 1030-1]